MRVTVIKGNLPDRVIVGFWIGDQMQSVVMSYTELGDIMLEQDIKEIMVTPVGIWKVSCLISLKA